jgi:uncharacterized integral membrane protein
MSNEYEYVYVIIIVLLFVMLRTRSQMRGRRANTRRIFMRPVLYGFLTLLILAITPNFEVLIFALLFGIIGHIIGTKLGVKSKVFEKDGIIRSKGSNEVFFIWIGAFILRLLIEIALPLPAISSQFALFSNYVNPSGPYFWYLVIDLLLAFSAGMLLGEARHIYRMYKSFKGNSKSQDQAY